MDFGAESSDEVQQKLLARFGRRFSAGSVVFADGDIGTEAFLLQEGRVRLIKRVGVVERSLRMLRGGDLFGESALITGAARNSTAVAITDGVMLVLDHATLEQVIASNPAVGMRVLQPNRNIDAARQSLKGRSDATKTCSASCYQFKFN